MKKFFFALALFTACAALAQQKHALIPLPKNIVEGKGSFLLTNKIQLHHGKGIAASLTDLALAGIRDASGLQLQAKVGSTAKNATGIVLQLSQDVAHDEGYVLDVTPAGIVIKAKKEAGLFYGVQTLLQLIPAEGKKTIPAVHIEDEPRFAWRGMMMDPCRHFWSVDFVKKFIDQLAYHKLNKMHWHLTEDQGWRIEIKKYPRLQTVAAYRNGTQVGYDRKKADSIRYGGYYTQEQIKEVVAYAAARYIEVIPEIEMPGHSVAAVTAYPNLACNAVSFETGKPHEVRQTWGVSKDIYCAGNDSVFLFLQDVLKEVMPLFPSKFLHIGGDEAPHEAWAKCAKCQQRMKAEGLKNEAELQSWFVRRMEQFINANGKRIIGWEEIMQGGLSPTATVHSWLGTQSGITASKMGNDIIMSPYSHLYFDGYQAESKIEPQAIGYWVPLDTVYAFDPRHPNMTDEDAKRLLGAQANVWAEFIKSESTFQYMVFPRIDALAEITWTPREKKDFTDFQQRLQTQLKRYDRWNINYRIPTPLPTAKFDADSAAVVSLSNRAGSGVVRYAVNSDVITEQSAEYKGQVAIKRGDVLHFAVFLPNGRKSPTEYFPKKARKR
ncbi:beta-N-acetylhexosaminidase [Pseudocnuella soli]|uniref:beta-N-acetylhexosaminidase n=1 Tax=Pseudocnuella soli TaxID=2502779 RepID=UPI001046A39D|nr:beta-N-acetylhexosaminidase [Pseudocnuella soli]